MKIHSPGNFLLFWSNFVKNIFLENCRQLVGECLEYFRFLPFHKLFINRIARAVP